ncbi:hypothetical protein D9M72_439590 [compost metagenome]
MAGHRQELLDESIGNQMTDAFVLGVDIGIVRKDLGDRLPVARLEGVFERTIILEQRFALAAQ